MLKNIILRDFKGLNGTFELSPRTVLTGPNGSGKSGVLDSYRILATGYTGMGKTPAVTHQLASAKTTEITGTCSDDSIVTRRFDKKGANVTQTISVNGTEKKAADYAPPPDLVLPAESLHPNEFLSLSGDKRAAWLSDNLKMTVGPVAPTLFPAIDAVIKIGHDDPIDKAFTLLAEKESILKKEVELCVSNIKRLSGGQDQLPSGTLAEWQEKLSKTESELETLSREQAQNEERAKLASSKVSHLQKLRDQVKQADAKIQESIKKLEDLVSRKGKIGPEAESGALEKLRNEHRVLLEKIASLRPELTRHKNSIKTFKEHKKCPTCGTDAEFLKDLLDDWDCSAGAIEGEIEELTEKATALCKGIQESEQGVKNASRIREIDTEIRVLEDALASYKKSKASYLVEIEKAEKDADMPVVSSSEVLAARIEGLRVQKSEAQENIKKFTSVQSLAGARVKAEQDRQDHEKKLSDIKSLVSDLKKARDTFLEKATSAIIAPFRTAVAAAFPGCDAYLQIVNDKGKPEVDFGIVKNEARISFDTLSGGEKLVVLAALVAALQIARCGRPLVCLMEMAEADSDRLDAVAAACDAIGFDQVLLATCHPPKIDFNPSWNVICMGAQQ